MQEAHVKTHRFEKHVLYLNDEGIVKCGAHVGTEATWTPSQWSAVGVAPVAVVDGMTLQCEDSRCTVRHE